MRSAVVAALVALLAVQCAIPLQLSSSNSDAFCQELEEENGEPTEPGSEQSLPEFVVPVFRRIQRTESRLVQRTLISVSQRQSHTDCSIPVEHALRNGTGGPLRC
jgi:hypothetical protein